MLITLFTDASYCHRTRVAAYAVWAKTDGRTVRHSGVLKDLVPHSALAETMALVNGIYLTIAAMRPPTASKIIALTGTIKRARSVQQFAAVVTAYQQKIAASGIEVEFRHVSGHRGTLTPRNAVNTWCDAECHRLMRQARAALLTPRAPPQSQFS